jgi:hypothetical protein
MARVVRESKSKGRGAKPATRAHRVVVAKEKSGPRAKAAAKAAPARPAPAEPVPPTPVAKSARLVNPATPARPAATNAPARPARQPVSAAAAARRDQAAPIPPDAPPAAGLTDEEQIESAKYLPRRVPARVFEEERFLFPQTYGVNRLRLLVKDPEWLFAHWDVDPRSLESLRADLGARAQALSQLTLRVFEDKSGGASTFLLPQDARTWYVPTRSAGHAYRAEVGVLLPSGEFRSLARSNSVVTPRVGRSAQKAKRRVRYDRARSIVQGAAGGPMMEEASSAEQPWDAPIDAGAGPEEERPRASSPAGKTRVRGGASDLHRR